MKLDNIIEKSITTGDLTGKEILFLLNLTEKEDIDKLLFAGNEVRRIFCGDEVHIRALMEISNVCSRNCNYCGLRSENKKLGRYTMKPFEIIEAASFIHNKGLKTVVLQSGENPYYTGPLLAEVIREIKNKTDLAITLCIGERTEEDYRLWKEAGAERYLLRHETAHCEHYALLHPDSDFNSRIECLKRLRNLGYQVGAGCMVGSPFQTQEHLAGDIEFIKSFQPDMIGIGPYISHPDTPFFAYPPGTVEMTLKMVALARIVTGDALIPATTAIGTIDELGREKALAAGADVVMPNFTPLKYRKLYEIYPDKICIDEDGDHCLPCIKMRIKATGRTIASGHGHSRKKSSVELSNCTG